MDEETLENPVTGETMRILESTPQAFRAHYSLRPHGEISEHFHPHKEQLVSVLSGEMHLRVNGEHKVIRAGESATVPPGARHCQWNSCEIETVAIEEIRPAGHIHDFFKVLFGLARDGRTDAHGRPPLLLSAVLFSEFRDSIRMAPFGTRFLGDLLAPVASALGYRRHIAKYVS